MNRDWPRDMTGRKFGSTIYSANDVGNLRDSSCGIAFGHDSPLFHQQESFPGLPKADVLRTFFSVLGRLISWKAYMLVLLMITSVH